MKRPLPFAISLDVGSSRANHTGAWRVNRPIYVKLLTPCRAHCPASEDVQRWLFHAEEGDYKGAFDVLVEDNPFPAVMGRVCFHPCESACNRAQLDEAVGINAVERFLGDHALSARWKLGEPGEESGHSVLVVGSGPAGLSAAYQLRRLGHHVTLLEQAHELGGMLRFGIPSYRLPRDVLDAELERLLALDIDVELDHRVEDLTSEMRTRGCGAAFVGIGAQLARRVEIPAGDSRPILDALSLLHDVASGGLPELGRRVVVYGGGDTAVDAARTATRLGATDAVIVYRRNRAVMPAHTDEVEEALLEGVKTRWLRTIARADAPQLVLEKMRLNRAGLAEPTGEYEEIDADCVVLALGEEADFGLLGGEPCVEVREGAIVVDETMATNIPGVFAGGDAVAGGRTVTTAIGHGKTAARAIDDYLAGPPTSPPVPQPLAGFERLNTWYYSDAPRMHRPELERARRASSFDEVVHGLSEENALFEARRCLSCANCFQCDNCYGMCPDNAIVKRDGPQPYVIDYDYCKGCGICAHECPCGAIEMVPEQI